MPTNIEFVTTARPRSVAITELICQLAGSLDLISDAARSLKQEGVTAAVRTRDNGPIFAWLLSTVSLQGISDQVAFGYEASHGRLSCDAVTFALKGKPSCPKLADYWHFADCRYHKGSGTCSEPEHCDRCPLPRHDLRNGRLNQTAYSLYLFMQDVADDDIVGWIDRRLADADLIDREASTKGVSAISRRDRLRNALLEPLSQVYGISFKVLSMSLADLLLAGDPDRPLWVETGATFLAIDTLVHNFLARSGILQDARCDHAYGPQCYGNHGCAAVIEALSAQIDAQAFNAYYPRDFPRFVQHAIWHFCAQGGLAECNGNTVDDSAGCTRTDCNLGELCARQPLRA